MAGARGGRERNGDASMETIRKTDSRRGRIAYEVAGLAYPPSLTLGRC